MMSRRASLGLIGTALALGIGAWFFTNGAAPQQNTVKVSDVVNPVYQIQSENWPQPAPRFYGTAQDWLNTGGKALDLKQLLQSGHVVLIDFWEYTCVNCLRTLPYLKAWNQRYAKDGLVIIGIHTPEFRFAHNRSNVAAAVKRLGITWPVLVDSNYENWNAYHNNFWPRDYFINMHGYIVADHAGEGGYEEAEALIQQLLHQLHPNLKLPPLLKPLRPEDAPGARCYPMTPELYAGQRGLLEGALGNIPNWAPGRLQQLPAPSGTLEDGVITPVGVWITEPESLRHGRATNNFEDSILLRYHAITANAVIKPESGVPFRVYVFQDGKPVDSSDKGDDIHYDETGKSYILVDQPRMYQLIHNRTFGSHTLTLTSNSPDFALYSFTFTSCTEG
ncbi:redoxin family protein [Chthonomonas calidirosea]|uniref:redoxin family protein n=1 Tax=Chthonomonas calidirosea TaxID=454171 RepID=UPI0009EBF4B3|nr:redoxin family protein [Chthonomonas calidirosea]